MSRRASSGFALLLAGLLTVPAEPAVAAPGVVDASATIRFRIHDQRDGIADRYIRAIAQDRDGFVWIGTRNGLNRFDGYAFRTFRHARDDAGSLPDNYVMALATTADGSVWVGTAAGGLARYDASLERFEPIPAASGWRCRQVRALFADRAGTLWVSCFDEGVMRLDPKTQALVAAPFGRAAEAVGVRAFAELSDGTLLLGSAKLWGWNRRSDAVIALTPNVPGVARFDPHAILVTDNDAIWVGLIGDGVLHLDRDGALRAHYLDVLPGGAVRGIVQRDDGSIWISTTAGLAVYRPDEDVFLRRPVDPDDPNGPPKIPGVLFEARDGTIWMGSWLGGVGMHDPDAQALRLYRQRRSTPSSLPSTSVSALFAEADGTLWVGLPDGGGLVHFAPGSGVVARFQHKADDPNSVASDDIVALARDLDGHLWVGTATEGLDRLAPGSNRFEHFRAEGAAPGPTFASTLPGDLVEGLHVDPAGTLWVALDGGGVVSRCRGCDAFRQHLPAGPAEGLWQGSTVSTIAGDGRGTIWIGALAGVGRIAPDGTLRHFRADPDRAGALAHDIVRAVLVDSRGRVWFGTAQGGLAQALPAADGDLSFRTFLADDDVGSIDCIVENSDGSLWLASSDRILRFDPDTGAVDALHGSQDLGTRGDYDNSCARQGSTLYFGGLDGLLAFDPERLPQQRSLGDLVLTDLWLFNQPLRPQRERAGGLLPRRVQDVESLELDYRQDVFGFSFAALEYRHPHSVTYRYRLVGLHDDWLPLAQGQRYASFAGVPSGRYVFEVAAQRGTSRSLASVGVVVGPPPWKSAPAYALYGAAALMVLMVLARAYRARRAGEARHVAELSRLANFDALTGLPNRTLFCTEIADALHASAAPLALFFIDLDRFKNINDSLGHRFGDRVLVAAGERLRAALPPGARLARLGGDEFTAMVPGLGDETRAAGVARLLLDAFATPLKVEGSEVVVTLSIGIALSPAHTQEWSALVQYADSAMYFAKGSGRNAYSFFRPEMTAQVSRRLALETSLRKAVEQGELYPVLQPKIALASGRIAGAEVLLRWQSAEHGSVSPAEFIPILEDTGMIEGVGLWLLREVCRQVRDWRAAGRASLRISINVSVHQLIHGELYERMAQLLREFEIPQGLLELEVTETAVMDNPEQMEAAVRALRALGLAVAIDDFGTGYSSLAYLSHLPVSTLKIDRAFVVGVGTSESADTLCAAIIAMAHNLKLEVVAEGVETALQHERLAAMGCDEAQGNLFSVPLRLDAFERFLDGY